MNANQTRTPSGSIFNILGALAMGLILAEPAKAVPFAWDPSAAGLAGASAFSGDALKATEVSHIQFTSAVDWNEHGFAKITGIENGGVGSTPAGLNSTYTLYFDFSGTGDFSTGTFTTATMTLYGVNGVSTFGIDANNNAYVDNGTNTAIALATASLISGTTGGAPGGDLFADIWTTFTATPAGSAVFLAPSLPRVIYGHFFHPIDEPGGITLVSDGIVLVGGVDTLAFVPEPFSPLLLIGGLPGMWLFRRRAARV